MNATKTKRKLVRHVRPPAEIRDNTKERRAWLAAKLEEINSQPNIEGKIVGAGSYQSISVYEVTEVAGRLRFRGICQFCGNSQVVDGSVLVLHGYKRPGDGYIFGHCPGMSLKPLNVEKTFTEQWLAQAITDEAEATTLLSVAEKARTSAREALYTISEVKRMSGYRNSPKSLRRNATPDERAAFEQQQKAFAESYPEHAASYKADARYSATRESLWRAQEAVRHFQGLLDSNIFGTELAKEVVV